MEKDFLNKSVHVSEEITHMYLKHVTCIRNMQQELNDKKKKIVELVDEGKSINAKIPTEIISVFENIVSKFETAIEEETFGIQTFIGTIYKNTIQNGFITKSLYPKFFEIEKMVVHGCPLHMAIVNNDYDKFLTLCEDKEELKRKDVWGRNVLHVAVSCSPKFYIEDGMSKLDNMSFHESEVISHSNALRMIKQLLQLELDPSTTDELLKWNSFEQANALNAFSALHLLCQHFTNYSIKFDTDFCLYVNASLFGYCKSFMTFMYLDNEYMSTTSEFMKKYARDHLGICDVVKKIKSMPDTKFYKDDFGNTLLHQAVVNGRTDFIRFFISTGAVLEEVNCKGETALHLACANDRTECVEVLLEHGANAAAIDKDGRTPLHNAVRNVNILKMLLRDNSDIVDMMDINGWTALHLAIKNSNFECVSLLREAGADINELTDKKLSALHIAVKSNNFQVFEYIVNNVDNIDGVDGDGLTPLGHAMQNSHFECGKLLIDKGASVNCEDKQKNTPLHLASMKGQWVLLKQLIGKKANVDAVNNQGQTALHLAIVNNDINCVRQLIKNKANVNCADKQNKSPLQLSYNFGCSMVALLIYNGAKDTFADHSLCNVLENNKLDVFDLLVSNGASINSALCYAKMYNRLKAIDLLVERGAISSCMHPQCSICRSKNELSLFGTSGSLFGTSGSVFVKARGHQ